MEYELEKFLVSISSGPKSVSLSTCIAHYVCSQYNDTRRHYHTLDHIKNCLEEFEAYKKAAQIPISDAIKYAIWYHDLIMNTNENEEISSDRACVDGIALQIQDSFIYVASRCILVTKHNKRPLQEYEKIMVDIDLSILGQDAYKYTDYMLKIRKEYSQFPDSVFYKGRKEILEGFLKREFLYSTSYFRDKYEKSAKENLSWEINECAKKLGTGNSSSMKE
jgi:predicted metal-dependent HD superfamily phosphohydrolase